MMKTSQAGRQAIIQREGVRLKAYIDSVGVWTIGVGHTGRASPPKVVPGMTITLQEADEILSRDLAPFENAVNRAVHRPMTQNEFDAFVSLAFNIGANGFAGASAVKQFNAGNTGEAARDFLLWDHPNALLGRRKAEMAQFLTPDNSEGVLS